jgi:hypothetical protein
MNLEGADAIELIATMPDKDWQRFLKRIKEFMELFG